MQSYLLRLGAGCLALCALAVLVPQSSAVRANVPDNLSLTKLDAQSREISQSGLWGAETGAWRTKTQFILDPVTHRLARKTFTVWDPAPSRNLDFVWEPSAPQDVSDPIVSGEGSLVWRVRDRPSYDTGAIVSRYTGTMKNGRPEGHGVFRSMDDVVYDGAWHAGLMEGQGSLHYPNGDEYVGAFLAGRLQGTGRYTDATGEIYEGTFDRGLRNGSGLTTLPNGQSYASQWRGGVELAHSLNLRNAQASLTSVPVDNDIKIALRVTPIAANDYKDPEAESAPDSGGLDGIKAQTVQFVQVNAPQNLVIRPSSNRLMGMWKGNTPLNLTSVEEGTGSDVFQEGSYGVFSLAHSSLPPLHLTLEVQNRATISAQITGAYLDVASSVSDLQPAIQISVGEGDYCSSDVRYSPRMRLENFGWGPARNAKISYDFISPKSKALPATYSHVKAIGDIAKTSLVTFEPDLVAGGFKASKNIPHNIVAMWDKIKFTFSEEEPDAAQKKTEADIENALRASKLYGAFQDKIALQGSSLNTDVAGKLEYDWKDASGAVKHRVSPFRITVDVGGFSPAAECGEGGAMEQIKHAIIAFKDDQRGYRLSVPFHKTVAAARVARYDLVLDSKRSSQHMFTLVLQLADGREIRSRPVDLLFYRPSWGPPEPFR